MNKSKIRFMVVSDDATGISVSERIQEYLTTLPNKIDFEIITVREIATLEDGFPDVILIGRRSIEEHAPRINELLAAGKKRKFRITLAVIGPSDMFSWQYTVNRVILPEHLEETFLLNTVSFGNPCPELIQKVLKT